MRILCIATHPDDETIGCGGTLLRHIAEGDSVSWLIVTETAIADYGAAMHAKRAKQIESVAARYGFASRRELKFPATRLSEIAERDLVGAFAAVLNDLEPDVIYLNHGGDVHSDHRVAFDAIMSAAKPFRVGKRIRQILSYETISETEQKSPVSPMPFIPNHFVDVSAYIDRKLETLSAYNEEVQPYPMPREASAIRALARWRGATFGLPYVEAFMVIREIR